MLAVMVEGMDAQAVTILQGEAEHVVGFEKVGTD